MYFKLVVYGSLNKVVLDVDALFYMCQIIYVLLFSSINNKHSVCRHVLVFVRLTPLFDPLQQHG